MTQTIIAIALGSALGGVSRYLAGLAIHASLARTFPWGTLAVNLIGSAAIGLLWTSLAARGEGGEVLRAFVFIGLLGGFTTFSSFSMETLLLVEQQAYGRAVAYVLASTGLCLAGAWAGLSVARHWSA